MDKGDDTPTPPIIAQDMIHFFNPTGKCLDPCRGNGVFYNLLPPGSDWCEIKEGRDFFEYQIPTDWIIGNPPYSMYSKWLYHSMTIAANIVYLAPLAKPFYSSKMMRTLRTWGHIKHIRVYGPGKTSTLSNFRIGYVIAAIHFQKGHQAGITFSYWTNPTQQDGKVGIAA